MATRCAILLAGGKSARMGRDKASLPWGATTLLAHVAQVLAEVADELVVVVRRDQVLPDLGPLPAGRRWLRVHDDVEGLGPLAGLAAGLAAATAPIAYVSACDVPHLTARFVRHVFDALGDAALVVPRALGGFHPLAAAYRRDAVLPVARTLLAQGRLRVDGLLDALPHVVLEEASLRTVDPRLDALVNVNTVAAYDAARGRRA